ncbi:MAG: hypothetical protein IH947_13355 [Bacteroidetes bacterium]|nr:hypothetical protein [Bacteroidota bacterium]
MNNKQFELELTKLKEQQIRIIDNLIIWKNDFKNSIDNDISKAIDKITEMVAKRFGNYITQEINSKLSSDKIRDLIKYHIKNTISSNDFDNIIRDITIEVIRKLNKYFKIYGYQYKDASLKGWSEYLVYFFLNIWFYFKYYGYFIKKFLLVRK